MTSRGRTRPQLFDDRWAELLLDVVEVVDADEDQAGRSAARLCFLGDIVDSCQREFLVAKAGHRVDQGGLLVADVFAQKSIGSNELVLALGHALRGEYAGQQLFAEVCFVQEVVDAGRKSLVHRFNVVLPGQKYHVREVLVFLVVLLHATRQLQAVHLRHHPIGDQYLRRALLDGAQCIQRVVADTHIGKTAFAERFCDDGAGELGIVHRQYWNVLKRHVN
jgi:hypothetical protein